MLPALANTRVGNNWLCTSHALPLAEPEACKHRNFSGRKREHPCSGPSTLLFRADQSRRDQNSCGLRSTILSRLRSLAYADKQHSLKGGKCYASNLERKASLRRMQAGSIASKEENALHLTWIHWPMVERVIGSRVHTLFCRRGSHGA